MPSSPLRNLRRPLAGRSRRSRRATIALAVAALAWVAWLGTAYATTGDAGDVNPLTVPKAIILGIVEGFTEYLPVSSTGHLLITERLLDLGTTDADKAATDTYTVAIQIGAILAVLGIYRHRFAMMIDGVLGRSDEGRQVLTALVVAFIPAAVIGFLAGDSIKEHLLEPWPVVAAWVVGGVAILIFTRYQDRLTVKVPALGEITVQQAAIIGLVQTLALWPGVSRSLVTILAALAVGLSMGAAVEFSFLLGFVTLSAATVYELASNGSEVIDTFGIATPLLGTVVAGIAAWASVRFMVSWLQSRGLALFGWYRIGIGALVAALIVGGAL